MIVASPFFSFDFLGLGHDNCFFFFLTRLFFLGT